MFLFRSRDKMIDRLLSAMSGTINSNEWADFLESAYRYCHDIEKIKNEYDDFIKKIPEVMRSVYLIKRYDPEFLNEKCARDAFHAVKNVNSIYNDFILRNRQNVMNGASIFAALENNGMMLTDEEIFNRLQNKKIIKRAKKLAGASMPDNIPTDDQIRFFIKHARMCYEHNFPTIMEDSDGLYNRFGFLLDEAGNVIDPAAFAMPFLDLQGYDEILPERYGTTGMDNDWIDYDKDVKDAYKQLSIQKFGKEGLFFSHYTTHDFNEPGLPYGDDPLTRQEVDDMHALGIWINPICPLKDDVILGDQEDKTAMDFEMEKYYTEIYIYMNIFTEIPGRVPYNNHWYRPADIPDGVNVNDAWDMYKTNKDKSIDELEYNFKEKGYIPKNLGI